MNNELRKNVKKFFWITVIFIGAAFLTAVLFVIYPKFFISSNIVLITEEDGQKEIPKDSEPTVIFPDKNLSVKVELAANPYQWSTGLMFRDKLEENSGMMFVFPNETTRNFWMKNVSFALDIIFISKDLEVADIKENFEPCPSFQLICPSYFSKKPATFVLEVNAGFVAKNGIRMGDKVELEAAQ